MSDESKEGGGALLNGSVLVVLSSSYHNHKSVKDKVVETIGTNFLSTVSRSAQLLEDGLLTPEL